MRLKSFSLSGAGIAGAGGGRSQQSGAVEERFFCRVLGLRVPEEAGLSKAVRLKSAFLSGVSDKRVAFFDKCVRIAEKQVRRSIIRPIFSYLRVRIICNARLLVKRERECGIRITDFRVLDRLLLDRLLSDWPGSGKRCGSSRFALSIDKIKDNGNDEKSLFGRFDSVGGLRAGERQHPRADRGIDVRHAAGGVCDGARHDGKRADSRS